VSIIHVRSDSGMAAGLPTLSPSCLF
jgi:hypothetical protein